MELEKDEFAFPEAKTFKIDFKYIISVFAADFTSWGKGAGRMVTSFPSCGFHKTLVDLSFQIPRLSSLPSVPS